MSGGCATLRGLRRAALVAIAAAPVAACGAASSAKPVGHPAEPSAAVRVERSRLGQILVDARGRTLYMFSQDRRGRSRCYRGCASLWPPATVSGRPIASPDLTAKLTTIRRRDDARQLVYNGHPLYTLIADKRPGQINGQGYSGQWFALSPAGHQIGHAGLGESY